jgi:hypothetical protein
LDTLKCFSKGTYGIRTKPKTRGTQEQVLCHSAPKLHVALLREIKISLILRSLEERAWPSQRTRSLDKAQTINSAVMREIRTLPRGGQLLVELSLELPMQVINLWNFKVIK